MAGKCVVDSVVGCHGEGNAVGGFGAREGEATTSGGGIDRVEIEVNMAVEFVNVDVAVAIELGDFEGGVRAKQVLKRFIERV